MNKILVLAFVLAAQTFSFSEKAEADVSSECGAAYWNDTAYQWKSYCLLWVASEPLIVGATDIKMSLNYWADLWVGGWYIGDANLWDFEEDELTLTYVGPGQDDYVMSGNVQIETAANKYQTGTNAPITYDELCVASFNEYYQIGTGWIYVPEYDREDCETVTAPPLP